MAHRSLSRRSGSEWTAVRGSLTLLAAMLLTLACGCAGTPKTAQASKVAPADIRVYESTELLHSQYSLVQHVWLDSWRSNLGLPSFKSEADGIDAMKRAASNAGANALLHVICVDARTKPSQGQKLYCYGDAIRVN